MNQKLSDWASLAEIVASVAVVITLIMLMIDVRENTEVVRSNSYDRLLGDVNEQALVIAQDERLIHIWRLYNLEAIAELTDEERFSLLTLPRSTFRTFEKAYFAYQYGTVGEREYERFDRQACGHFDRARLDLCVEIKQVLSDDFGSILKISARSLASPSDRGRSFVRCYDLDERVETTRSGCTFL